MLHLRIVTAVVALPVVLVGIYLGAVAMLVVASITTLIAIYEYRRMARFFDTPPPYLFSAVLALSMLVASLWGLVQVLLAAVAAVLAVAIFHFTAPDPHIGWKSRWIGAAGPFLVGMPLALAVLMRDEVNGLAWVTATVLCTFAQDTGAYTVGRLIGRRPLAPDVSPNKTWEGAVGGGVGCVLLALLLNALLSLDLHLLLALGYGVTMAVTATWGDLTISSMKRIAGVKDSGTLLPGHGGVLDRMDSLLLTLPYAYLWQTIAML